MFEFFHLPGTRMRTRVFANGTQDSQQEHNDSWGGAYFLNKTDPSGRKEPIGWLYPKPYSMSTYYVRKAHGTIASSHPTDNIRYQRYSGCLDEWGLSPSLQLPSGSSNLQRSAEIQALTKLKAQKVNFGVALAEAQRTADFVGDVATTLGRSAQHARQGRWRKAVEMLGGNWKQLPSKWLGWNYAATPLLNDVKGSLDLLTDPRRLNQWLVTTKGIVTSKNKIIEEHAQDGFGLPLGRTVVHDQTVGYFVRLDYYPDNSFLYHMANLGLSNPMEIVWEAVPYSFVVDWMLPIGEWFHTMDAAVGFRFLSGSCTERLEVKTSVKPKDGPLWGGWQVREQSFSASGRRLNLTRSIYASSPIPAAPRIKNPLSLGHMANGLALLATAFGRRR